MTTSVRIINEGPLDVRVTVKDAGVIRHIVLIGQTHVSSAICLYDTRTIEVEEVKPTKENT